MGSDFHSPQRIARLTPLADILATIAKLRPAAASEASPAETLGHVLAEDATVTASRPEAAIALRDGFAMRADTTADASAYAPIPLPQRPHRIDAGEALPTNADAVAPLDTITFAGSAVQAIAALTAGDGVLAAGVDAVAGKPLRKAGQRLRASDIAALQACEIARVKIRKPHIRIVQAGANEKAAPTITLIASMTERAGCNVSRAVSFEHALEAGDSDAIFAIGGTGTGRHDNAVEILSRNRKLSAHGIGLMPGDTAAFGFAGERPVLLLPGRIDAALSVWLAIGRPLLSHLSGETDEPPSFPATLSRKIASAIGIVDLVLVRRDADMIEPLASGYWPMQAITRADGYVLVPPQSEGYAQGSIVTMRPLP
jgi:molybdopterin biosynthesis enzyme